MKYTPDEARNLKTYGEFPETVRINDTVTFVEDGLDEDIEFGDDFSSADEADPVDGVSTTFSIIKKRYSRCVQLKRFCFYHFSDLMIEIINLKTTFNRFYDIIFR